MNLYIHVPFCASRCTYCDFYTQTNKTLKQDYLQALEREMEIIQATIYNGDIEHIYLGGGTPSLLSARELDTIFNKIYSTWQVLPHGEHTLEANPDDLSIEYTASIASLPINRVSMGAQSFDNKDLKFLNRRHAAGQVYEAVDNLRHHGITNISVDLIYGLPKQTLEMWDKNMDAVLSLDIPHISSYHLIYEEGTPMTKLLNLGKIKAIDEDISLQMFRLLIHRLKAAGYEHYEISNFAQPGAYARLNTDYWRYTPYIGLGPSAHSFYDQSRLFNVSSIQEYTRMILREDQLPQSKEVLTVKDLFNETILTGLRTMWGINVMEIKERFGNEVYAILLKSADKYLRQNLIKETANHHFILTEEGIFVSDGIMSDLFM